jgi:prepilin-type N-terminal cleavage/methylation domain-containing protein
MRERGMTLMEVMIAVAILSIMLVMTWQTVHHTVDNRRTFEQYEERNHELRNALGRIVDDFAAAYLSRNEDANASHPRTLLVAKAQGRVPKIRFSTLGHRPLWADANESEQTVIEYLARNNPDPDHSSEVDLIRREQRRPSNQPPEEEPSEYDILARDIVSLKLEFWNWKNLAWQEEWDTTQSDGQRGWLPSRVRITLTVRGPDGKDLKYITQAGVHMQEPLLFSPSG